MAKETDLLRDPLVAAQIKYQEQIVAFKEQFIPKQSSRKINEFTRSYGFSPDILKDRIQ